MISGDLVRTITVSNLTAALPDIRDVSVSRRGDKLAVACKANGIKTYNIVR